MFHACATIPPGMKVLPEFLFTPDRIQILALWADSVSDDHCPWPGHIFCLRRKIGCAPQWWVDSDPEDIWCGMFPLSDLYSTKLTHSIRMSWLTQTTECDTFLSVNCSDLYLCKNKNLCSYITKFDADCSCRTNLSQCECANWG